MRLFVYGSLKKGFFNHDRFGFGRSATLLGEGVVKDVSLVRLGNLPYPHAFKNAGGEVKGELYELNNPDIAEALEDMERGAGYMPHLVTINGEDALMYVADGWTEKHRIRPALANNAEFITEWKEVG